MSDEQVSQFMSITGSADPEAANTYLEMSGGDLGTAVGLYMEHNTGGGGGGAGFGAMDGGGGDAAVAAAAAAMSPQDVRAPDATRTMRLMDDDVGPHPAYQMRHEIMESQLTQSAFAAASPVGNGRSAREIVNAAAAAESKQGDDDDDEEYRYDSDADGSDDDVVDLSGGSAPPAPARLADLFAEPTHLMHKAGGFQGARSSAKDSKRWLLVNLQRDAEFSCHALNRDVWRNELVENLVREGFIFWQTVRIGSRQLRSLFMHHCTIFVLRKICFCL